MLSLRRSAERGAADHGWLKSRHTFSFGSYYDPQRMGVSALRVINDDKVVPGGGFATHPHKDMEILSYILSGSLEHKDSMGNVRTMGSGEFQLMSAGSGVTHSEYNPSTNEPLRFLQIWIKPDKLGVAPGYQQKSFIAKNGLTQIAGPEVREESNDHFLIHQDARIYRLQLQESEDFTLHAVNNRPLYMHLVSGDMLIDQITISEGDAITLREGAVNMVAKTISEALVFDLPPAHRPKEHQKG